MKEKIEKRIGEIKESQKIMQERVSKLEQEKQEIINQFLASQGAVRELEDLLKVGD